jgi:hypothetical protein
MKIQNLIRLGLVWISRLHPKNWTQERWSYPQLWYCFPRWTRRRTNPKLYALRIAICGRVTGHELSNTEWGYGGGNLVDRHCRWCDKLIQVPRSEEQVPAALKDIADAIGFGDPQ